MMQPNFQAFFFLLASLSWSGSKCDQSVRARPEQTQAVVVVVGVVGVFELLPERQREMGSRMQSRIGLSPLRNPKNTTSLILRTK